MQIPLISRRFLLAATCFTLISAPVLAQAKDVKSVTHLSGGERRRVAIARTLLASPQLILMDEPLSSLDTTAKAELLPLIAGLSHNENIPILYVSHDWSEIAKLANRVLHLKDGTVSLTSLQSLSPSLDGLLPIQINALAKAALSAGLSPLPI